MILQMVQGRDIVAVKDSQIIFVVFRMAALPVTLGPRRSILMFETFLTPIPQEMWYVLSTICSHVDEKMYTCMLLIIFTVYSKMKDVFR